MSDTLDDYVSELPARAIVRDDLNSGNIRLNDILLGVSGTRQEKNGVDYKFYCDNGVRLYNWGERLSIIGAVQNNENYNNVSNPNNLTLAQSIINVFEHGNLARKRKEAQDYIAEYESGMYAIDGNDKRSQYNARRKKEKYERSIAIIAKADTVYNRAKELVEQAGYISTTATPREETETTYAKKETKATSIGEPTKLKVKSPVYFGEPIPNNLKRITPQMRKTLYRKHFYSSANALHPRKPMHEFKCGVPLSPETYADFITSEKKLYDSISPKEPITDRLNYVFDCAFIKNPVVRGISQVVNRIDNAFGRKINTVLYGDPVHTPAPFDLPAREIAMRKARNYLKNRLSGIKKKAYAHIHNIGSYISFKEAEYGY